jgi:hypothetical protein
MCKIAVCGRVALLGEGHTLASVETQRLNIRDEGDVTKQRDFHCCNDVTQYGITNAFE